MQGGESKDPILSDKVGGLFTVARANRDFLKGEIDGKLKKKHDRWSRAFGAPTGPFPTTRPPISSDYSDRPDEWRPVSLEWLERVLAE